MVLHNPDDKISIAYSMNGVQYYSNEFLKNILNLLNEKDYVKPQFIELLFASDHFLKSITGIYVHQLLVWN